jgi:hypothetical protein
LLLSTGVVSNLELLLIWFLISPVRLALDAAAMAKELNSAAGGRPMRVILSSILAVLLSMTVMTSGPVSAQQPLNNGDVFYLKCLGNVPGPVWLNGLTASGRVELANDTSGTGTRWQALRLSDGSYLLKCLGTIPGPVWLNGLTASGQVELANNTSGSGTRWQVIMLGDGSCCIKCLGTIPGPVWLNGLTASGQVELANNTSGSGTRWAIYR